MKDGRRETRHCSQAKATFASFCLRDRSRRAFPLDLVEFHVTQRLRHVDDDAGCPINYAAVIRMRNRGLSRTENFMSLGAQRSSPYTPVFTGA